MRSASEMQASSSYFADDCDNFFTLRSRHLFSPFLVLRTRNKRIRSACLLPCVLALMRTAWNDHVLGACSAARCSRLVQYFFFPYSSGHRLDLEAGSLYAMIIT